MGQGPDAVVLIHLGGVYGDREGALARVVPTVTRLPAPARRRLAFENDERVYSVRDCLRVHEATGVPVIFDHHHHHPGGMDAPDAALRAFATWPAGVVPKMHFSSPRLDCREDGMLPPLNAHADQIHPWDFGRFLASLPMGPDGGPLTDVMLEAKQKDRALLRLRADLARLYPAPDAPVA